VGYYRSCLCTILDALLARLSQEEENSRWTKTRSRREKVCKFVKDKVVGESASRAVSYFTIGILRLMLLGLLDNVKLDEEDTNLSFWFLSCRGTLGHKHTASDHSLRPVP
jgi:hypothetical protein